MAAAGTMAAATGAMENWSGAETAAQPEGAGAREKSVKVTVWQDGAHEKRSTQHVVSMSEGRAADHKRDAVTAAKVERGEADMEVAAVRPGESEAVTAANVCRGDGEREACVGQSAPLWPWARQRKQRPAHWGQFCETCPERWHEKHERADVSRGGDSSGEGWCWGLGAPAASVI